MPDGHSRKSQTSSKHGHPFLNLQNMNEFDVRRLALILAVQAEIEGMKAANSQYPDNQPYQESAFLEKSNKLSDLAFAHNQQLF